MRSESVSSAKNRLSALLREVQGGASIVITDRGIPVARLVPVRPAKGIPAVVIALAQQGLMSLPEQTPSARWLDLPLPRLEGRASAVEALLEERQSDR
jgi:prevent-host-death family protein